ncbi:hypothetical protein LR48_Vigan06g124300 [Vigna angularis]|uniref:Uncharacterized protein n=1 Tax=Phaseolus angularis TaxID=3914 RepID=A0A0L9UTM9_PHAAN|nr:hypothetical protein LR48_Vigan06g124300 [Vigna angularis]
MSFFTLPSPDTQPFSLAVVTGGHSQRVPVGFSRHCDAVFTKARRRSTRAMKDPGSPPRATIEGENTLESCFRTVAILAAVRSLSLLEMNNVLAPKTGWFARRKRGEAGCSLT